MSGRRIAVVIGVLVALGAGIILASRIAEEQRVRRAIARYDLALREAVRTLDEKPLAPVTHPRELGRVRSYLILLKGTATRLEVELLDLQVESVRSTSPTITALAVERWREIQRDTVSGAVRAGPSERVQRIEYTLLPDETGRLRVYLSRIVEDGSR